MGTREFEEGHATRTTSSANSWRQPPGGPFHFTAFAQEAAMTPGTTTQERCCGVRKSAMTSDIRSYIVRGGEAPTVSAYAGPERLDASRALSYGYGLR